MSISPRLPGQPMPVLWQVAVFALFDPQSRPVMRLPLAQSAASAPPGPCRRAADATVEDRYGLSPGVGPTGAAGDGDGRRLCRMARLRGDHRMLLGNCSRHTTLRAQITNPRAFVTRPEQKAPYYCS